MEPLVKVNEFCARHCVVLLGVNATVGLGNTVTVLDTESLQPEAVVATSLMV